MYPVPTQTEDTAMQFSFLGVIQCIFVFDWLSFHNTEKIGPGPRRKMHRLHGAGVSSQLFRDAQKT